MKFKSWLTLLLVAAALFLPGAAWAQALYSDNFDSDTVGSIAPGWTAVSGTWTVNTLNSVSSPNDFGEASPVDNSFVTYTGMPARADMTVQFSEVFEQPGGSNVSNIWLIIDTSSAATNGYVISLNAATGNFNIYKSSGLWTLSTATLSGNVTNAPFGVSMAPGTMFNLKADYNGAGVLKFKAWAVGASEPSTWAGTVTDSSPITTPGYVTFREGLAGSPTYAQIDNFYVGATGATFNAAPTSYTLTGASTLTAGTASTFTAATNTGTSPTNADTLTYSDNLTAHGSFSPTTQAVGTTGATSFSVSYTPPTGYTGSVTLTATSADGLTAGTATATVTNGVATSFTMSESASTGPTGSPVTLTFTGQGTTTATVAPSSTVAGTFSPTTVTLNGTTAVTATFTPSASGTATITATNTGALTSSPTSLTYTISNSLAIGLVAATPVTNGIAISLTSGLSGGSSSGYSYHIFRSTSPTGSTSGAPTFTTSTMPYTDTTAVAGTFYWYKLVGVDGLGNSTNSAPVAETGVNTATTTDLSVVAIYYTSILNIVYIGDSITAGGALPTGSITAPTQCSTYLQSMTGIRNVFYANAGVGGFTTTTFLPSVNTSNCFVNAVNDATSLQTANPAGQLVFSIMLGTNDSDTGSDGSPCTAAQLGANLETIIGQLMIDFPAAKCILQTPPLYTANAAVGADYEEAGLARLISYFPEYPVVVAYENSLYPGHMFMGDTTAPAFFAPLYTTEMVIGIGNNGYYYLHPNQQGSNDLARLWANGIYNALFALATTSGRGRTLK